ncbi:MAG: enoyl-CoA hydratase/isomerase family protein, partial [Gammaproteobacteria bacterium]
MAEHIVIDRSDPACVVVTLNRPKKRNALTLGLWRELAAIFGSLEGDKEARVVILTGAGGCFCAGADISEFGEVRTGKKAGEIYEAAVEQCNLSVRSLSKPTIAAISGFCIGGGFALAQVCDFRVADLTAVFSLPPARLGIVYSQHECEALLALVGL